MQKVSEETKRKFLTDSTQKQIYIEVEDEPGNLEGINWYFKNLDTTREIKDYIILTNTQYELYNQFLAITEYMYISCNILLTSFSTLPEKLYIAPGGSTGYSYEVDLSNDWVRNALTNQASSGLRLYTRVPREEAKKWTTRDKITFATIRYTGNIGSFSYRISEIQIQSTNKLYSFDELYPVNIRNDISNPKRYGLNYLGICPVVNNKNLYDIVKLPRPHIDPITNKDLEMENFSFTESICSDDNLVLGCCEAAHSEFTIIDKDISLKGRYIRPYIVCSNISSINWFHGGGRLTPGREHYINYNNGDLRYRFFLNIDTAINQKYLRANNYAGIQLKIKVSEFVSETTPYNINIGFSVTFENATYYYGQNFRLEDVRNDFVTVSRFWDANSWGGIKSINSVLFLFTDENGNATYEDNARIKILFKEEQVRSTKTNSVTEFPTYTTDDCLEWRGIDVDELVEKRSSEELIPLGRMRVTGVEKKNANTILRLNVTAQDDISKLAINASNWYTMQMYGVSTDQWTGEGIEYPRQLYSSLWNILEATKLVDKSEYDNYEIYSTSSPYAVPTNVMLRSWDFQGKYEYYLNKLQYAGITVNTNPDYIKYPWVVDINYRYRLDSKLPPTTANLPIYWSYKDFVDKYGRGVLDIADILVKENVGTLENPIYNKFCVNNGDYFLLSPNCVQVEIYIPYAFLPHAGSEVYGLLNTNDPDHKAFTVSMRTNKEIDLVNGSRRLMYYDINTRKIFPCDSSITAMDVVRSLLELTGCFFNIDRNGDIEFKYCVEAGIYPSNDLYPADDLYPVLDSERLPMGLYVSAECSDYEVQNYGRIQILKSGISDEDNNTAQYEYVGDPALLNAYVIKNNIFYSNSNMVYKQNMKDVNDALAAMYEKIRNLHYTPNTTICFGMPWIEPSDRITVLTKTGGFESFIFRRTLKGIHSLKDTLEASGDEYTGLIEDYGYKMY